MEGFLKQKISRHKKRKKAHLWTSSILRLSKIRPCNSYSFLAFKRITASRLFHIFLSGALRKLQPQPGQTESLRISLVQQPPFL